MTDPDDLRIEKIIAQHEAAEQERLLYCWLDEAEIALALGELAADLDLPRATHATLEQE
jgi:hypothetical protein